MDITTKTVTTKVHTGTYSVTEMKTFAERAAVRAAQVQIGIADSAIVSKSATMAEDGSVSVEIVEQVGDAAPVPAVTTSPSSDPAVATPAEAAPTAAPAATPAAPAFHFPKAA